VLPLLTDHPSDLGFVSIDYFVPINDLRAVLEGFASLFVDKMTTGLMVLGDPENQ